MEYYADMKKNLYYGHILSGKKTGYNIVWTHLKHRNKIKEPANPKPHMSGSTAIVVAASNLSIYLYALEENKSPKTECSVVSDSLWLHGLYSPSSSSAHGIFQARLLEWVAISYCRGYSQSRDQTGVSCVSCIGRQILYHWEVKPYRRMHTKLLILIKFFITEEWNWA